MFVAAPVNVLIVEVPEESDFPDICVEIHIILDDQNHAVTANFFR